MIIEQLSMSIPHGKRAEIGRAISSQIGPTQVQPGCTSCHFYRKWSDPEELMIETHWGNEEDLIRHLQSDIYKSFLQLMEVSLVPPVLKFYTIGEVRGLDLVKAAREPSDDRETLSRTALRSTAISSRLP
jgi:quinol monooxygenase YgiN